MKLLLYSFCFLVLFSSCKNRKKSIALSVDSIAESNYKDHSYSNLDSINTTHLDLELDVDFNNQTIYGIARHTMNNKGTRSAIFDIKGLQIKKVTLGSIGNERETDFMIGKMDADSILGQPLIVSISKKTHQVNIYYQTTKASEALDWLDTAMTSSKTKPFLYTQGQAILTRTWIPVQDSPSNRFTYAAQVKVPNDLLALMSAKNPSKKNETGIYNFTMEKAIPSYLIALAVGDIAYHSFGGNTGVYAEKELIDACAEEFDALPKMMGAASKLYGKYQWGQYDVLVLPYSFPFGGMENPRLTFANPTLITGDKSLVSVIAHELAHSWSGNLVTNNSWDDFWLNEGFTVYFEERIMEEIYGKEVADILAEIEFFEMQQEMKEISSGDHPEDTKLHLKLKNRNPDDGMTQIAYVKGAFFLKTLEAKVGREKLDKFLNSYFESFKFKTVTSKQFESVLQERLLDPNKIKFNYKEWIYEEGLPKNCVKIVSTRLQNMTELAQNFSAGVPVFEPKIHFVYQKIKGKRKKKKVKVIEQIKRDDFIVQEWQVFIRNLDDKITVNQLNKADNAMHFSTWNNSEILTEWFVLNIQKGNATKLRPEIKRFISKVGRRKYLMPIYKALSLKPADKRWAKEVFEGSKSNYHAVSKNSIEQVLK